MEETIRKIDKNWHKNGHLNKNQRNYLVDLLTKLKPKSCIETGFATGRSTVTILEAATPNRLVSIDIDLDYMQARDHAELLLSRYDNLTIIEDKSQLVLTETFFNKHFKDGIDFAFIDGEHTYNGALHDMTKIYTHMNNGAFMIIDDYNSGKPDGASIKTVNKAVDDFAKNNNKGIIKWNNNGKGFAIIIK